jgi:hypothetical protein
MSKVKKILNKEDELAGDNEVVFYLSYNDDMTEIVLMAKCKSAMTPNEYIETLIQFVDDASEFPDKLFVESGEDRGDMH